MLSSTFLRFRTLLLSLMALCCEGEQCDPEGAACEGNVAVTCGRTNREISATETREDCGAGKCVEHEGRAFCAVSAEPDERCGAGERESFCDGQNTLRCEDGGYMVLSLRECAASTTCVETEDPPNTICGEVPQTDECPPGLRGGFCAGAEALRCYDGYVLLRTHCASSELCYVPQNDYRAECRESGE
jgi:hypothetical protein